jgi:hypothetical protein
VQKDNSQKRSDIDITYAKEAKQLYKKLFISLMQKEAKINIEKKSYMYIYITSVTKLCICCNNFVGEKKERKIKKRSEHYACCPSLAGAAWLAAARRM